MLKYYFASRSMNVKTMQCIIENFHANNAWIKRVKPGTFFSALRG